MVLTFPAGCYLDNDGLKKRKKICILQKIKFNIIPYFSQTRYSSRTGKIGESYFNNVKKKVLSLASLSKFMLLGFSSLLVNQKIKRVLLFMCLLSCLYIRFGAPKRTRSIAFSDNFWRWTKFLIPSMFTTYCEFPAILK